MKSSSLETLKNKLKEIKVIGFDLDDTLWDNRPVIKAANEAQFNYLEQVIAEYSREQIEHLYHEQVSRLITQDEQKFQDMTLLRQTALKELCEKLSVPSEVAEKTFNCFYKERQSFQIYPEALTLLELLSHHVKLIAISNGNAMIKGTSLAPFFDLHWRAGVQGEAKPSGDMLIKASDYYGVKLEQFAYVGDNPTIDGMATKNAGCLGLLVNPNIVESEINKTGLYRFNNLSELFDCFNLVYGKA